MYGLFTRRVSDVFRGATAIGDRDRKGEDPEESVGRCRRKGMLIMLS